MLNIPEHTFGKYTLIVHKVECRGELLVCLTSHCTAMVWHGQHSVRQIADAMSIHRADAQAVHDFMAAYAA